MSARPSRADLVRAALGRGAPLVLGGIYDGLSARLAERAGFEVLFIGGLGIAASLLGEPDIGLLTQTEMVDAARRLCRLTSRPVLVDADTGYGNVLNVRRTAEAYYAAGAAGLFLEDQVWPKRCGHLAGKQVVDREEWAAKLQAVLALRPEMDLFLVARTDAAAVLGIEEAIERGRLARDLGADAIFIEAPESVADLERIARTIPGPKVANMVEHGRTPLLSPVELHKLGFDLIVHPLAGLLAAARAIDSTFATLRQEGTMRGHLDELLPFAEFNERLGLERHRAFEARFPEAGSKPGRKPAS